MFILCPVDGASLHNLVNKTNLVHNVFLVCLYLSIFTCFGRLWAHRQEKQLCFCDTCYSVWITVWYAEWNSTLHTRQSSTQNNKYQVSHFLSVSSQNNTLCNLTDFHKASHNNLTWGNTAGFCPLTIWRMTNHVQVSSTLVCSKKLSFRYMHSFIH